MLVMANVLLLPCILHYVNSSFNWPGKARDVSTKCFITHPVHPLPKKSWNASMSKQLNLHRLSFERYFLQTSTVLIQKYFKIDVKVSLKPDIFFNAPMPKWLHLGLRSNWPNIIWPETSTTSIVSGRFKFYHNIIALVIIGFWLQSVPRVAKLASNYNFLTK